MLQVTNFLLRWLYLSTLVRERADIQSLPHYPRQGQDHPLSGWGYSAQHNQYHQMEQGGDTLPMSNQSGEDWHYREYGQQQGGYSNGQSRQGSLPHSGAASQPHRNEQRHHLPSDVETEWRNNALRYISSYPAGAARLYALDGLRMELVLQLRRTMAASDKLVIQEAANDVFSGERQWDAQKVDDKGKSDGSTRDADDSIIDEMRTATTDGDVSSESEESDIGEGDVRSDRDDFKAAHSLRVETSDYLPQLVSSVLHSPPAVTNVKNLDPISSLRSLLIDRCLVDPNLGIELCWILEAEVGRTWKQLFEHRQRTGRRLILFMPADKAAVLAKIGTEKRASFDLLQDVEQATAFGCRMPDSDGPIKNSDFLQELSQEVEDSFISPPRLPSSLSQRRCSHYGDTMHFLDRLTQISLDLGRVPALQRPSFLKESLSELNRRVRRRMFSKGDVSLDVEDGLGPFEWPTIKDINVDMLKYSVHFPLEPKSASWPSHDGYKSSDPNGSSQHGVQRVLNIVSDNARILASRERCPFLIHLEVAETGLQGNDARLYASGVNDVMVSLEEALGMLPKGDSHDRGGFTPYQIPHGLLSSFGKSKKKDNLKEGTIQQSSVNTIGKDTRLPRGGWQDDGNSYYPIGPGEYLNRPSPYERVREEELEQLHRAMQGGNQPNSQVNGTPQQGNYGPYGPQAPAGPVLSAGKALLDKVYGEAWEVRCATIRKQSSYGKVKGWRLASFIVKAGEDIRREALVMQVISKMKDWFDTEIPEENRPYLRPYTIMCIGGDAGALECVHDAMSVDEVKKNTDGYTTLRDYFERAYGPPGSSSVMTVGSSGSTVSFETAQFNFLRSLVGYSLICYVLQIKDRHNANILMSREGHLMHIDFGFVLGDTPKMGKVPLFSERAPFKLTQEFWDVLGGWNYRQGGLGVRFCKMFEAAFACASSHADEIASQIEAAILNLTWNADEARMVANGVRARLRMRGAEGSVHQKVFIMDLVEAALTSWGTSTYDWLQKSMNGYQ